LLVVFFTRVKVSTGKREVVVALTIKTNNVPRDIVNAHELAEKERKEFDYLNWQAIERGEESASFVRYRGVLYSLSDFVRIVPRSGNLGPMGFCHPIDDDSPLANWHGILTDSFFSGIVLRFVDDDGVIVGLLLS